MSELIGTSPQTNIAAVSWADGDKTQVRVYTLDGHGYVRESAYNGTTWTFNKDPIAKARNASGLAALKHGENIHVYYLAYYKPPRDPARIVVEEVYRDYRKPLAGNWEAGPLSALKVTADDYSGLAAISHQDNIAVFFLRWNKSTYLVQINQVRRDSAGVWKQLEPFAPKAIWGSSLAAVAPDPYGSAQVRLYFLPGDSDKSLSSVGVEDNGSYQPGGVEMNMKIQGSKIAAVSNEIYYFNANFGLCEGSFYNGDWHYPNHPDNAQAQPGSGIAITLDGSGLHRAYIQDDKGQIVEFRFVRPFDKDPDNKTVIPTGNDY